MPNHSTGQKEASYPWEIAARLCIECYVIRRVKGERLEPEFLAKVSDLNLSHKEDPFGSGSLTLVIRGDLFTTAYFLCRDLR